MSFKCQNASSIFHCPNDLSDLQLSNCLSVLKLVTKKKTELNIPVSCSSQSKAYIFCLEIEKILNTICERKQRRWNNSELTIFFNKIHSAFFKLGTEEIGMNRVIFLMIKIYEELHVHQLSVISTLKWTNCSEREECNKISKIPNCTFVVQSLG